MLLSVGPLAQTYVEIELNCRTFKNMYVKFILRNVARFVRCVDLNISMSIGEDGNPYLLESKSSGIDVFQNKHGSCDNGNAFCAKLTSKA